MLSKATAPASRILWIDYGRAIAVLLVIVGHANFLLTLEYEMIPSLATAFNVMGPFRMPMLTFLSGWIADRAMRKPWGEFTAGKLRSLVWPYLVWTVVFFIVADSGYSLFSFGLYAYSYLWFLMYVFVYLMVSRLLRDVPRAALALFAFSCAIIVPDQSLLLQRFLLLWGVFLVGELAAAHAQVFARMLVRPSLIPLVAGALILAGYAATGADVEYRDGLLAPTLAGIVVLCAFTTYLERFSDSRVLRGLAFVGRNSNVFYLVHVPVQFMIVHASAQLGVRSPWVVFALNAVGGVLTSFLLAVLNERNRVVRVLFTFPRRKSRPAPATEEPRGSFGRRPRPLSSRGDGRSAPREGGPASS